MDSSILSRTGVRLRSSPGSYLFQIEIIGPILICALAVGLTFVSLQGIDLARMNDLGLISVLPFEVLLSVALITASFVYTLTRPVTRGPLLALHLIVLIFLFTGLTLLLNPIPRYSVTWRHAGVVEYITRLGKIEPRIDAYFNWPIFFTISAMISEVAGLPSILVLADWVPLLYNILYLGPLIILFDTAIQDRRYVWLSVWLFYLFNWIGQDYFSPQGLNFFLYLLILAIVLRWFTKQHLPSRQIPEFKRSRHLRSFIQWIFNWIYSSTTQTETISHNQRRGLLAIVFLVFAFMVSSHQLTPLALLLAVSLLALFNRIHYRFLPAVMLVMVILWLVFAADTFLAGRIDQLIASIGQLDDAVNANVVDRLEGSPGHTLVVRARMLMTILIWGLAFVGGIYRVVKGKRDLNFVLLASAPFFLMGLLLYGGEMLMRVFLLSLPFMVFFATSLFWEILKPHVSWWRSFVLFLACLIFAFAHFLVRYGNERMDRFTVNEAVAVTYVYNVAKPGSLLASASSKFPFKFQNYEMYETAFFTQETVTGDVETILNQMSNSEYAEAYLILTRSQQANLELFYSFSLSEWNHFLDMLYASDQLELLYENEEALVFRLNKP